MNKKLNKREFEGYVELHPAESNAKLSRVFGISVKTIARARTKLNKTEELQKLSREKVISRFEGGLDCKNCDLTGVDLSGLDLRGMSFKGSNLSQVKFNGTNLRCCGLINCIGLDLTGAEYNGAHFKELEDEPPETKAKGESWGCDECDRKSNAGVYSGRCVECSVKLDPIRVIKWANEYGFVCKGCFQSPPT